MSGLYSSDTSNFFHSVSDFVATPRLFLFALYAFFVDRFEWPSTKLVAKKPDLKCARLRDALVRALKPFLETL